MRGSRSYSTLSAMSSRSALVKAAHDGVMEEVERLLAEGADIQKTDQSGFSALHFAAWGDHRNMVQLLLDKDANVHARTKDERTPLSCASAVGSVEIVQLLLARFADANIKMKGGNNTEF